MSLKRFCDMCHEEICPDEFYFVIEANVISDDDDYYHHARQFETIEEEIHAVEFTTTRYIRPTSNTQQISMTRKQQPKKGV